MSNLMLLRRPRPAFVLALCIGMILPSIAYFAARFLLPGDGYLIDFEASPADGNGFYILPLVSSANELQDGDQLVAIQGRGINEWLEGTLSLEGARAPISSSSALRYTVSRNGQVTEIELKLDRIRLADQLRGRWPSFLYPAYLEGIALFVFTRRPRLAAAQLLLLFSSTAFGSLVIFFVGLQPSDLVRGWPVWLFLWGVALYGLALGAGLHFALIFPKKRQVLVRRPRTLWLVYLGVWVLYFAGVGIMWSGANSTGERFWGALRSIILMVAVYLPLILSVTIFGYRTEFNSTERRQVRLVLWGMTVAFLPWIVLWVIPTLLGLRPVLPLFASGLLWLASPTAMAIAILREHLFGIDLIINRTLVYGILSSALAAVYFISVSVMQSVFNAFTGQQSPIAVVASTLAIAALFNPLRIRIQSTIDRRLYRSKYDAALALSGFAESVRDEVDLGRMQSALLATVEETMRPTHVSLWFRSNLSRSETDRRGVGFPTARAKLEEEDGS